MNNKSPQEIADERRLKTYWNKADLAAEFGVTTRTVNDWMKKKLVPSFTMGKRTVRFIPQEVRDAVSRRRVASRFDVVS